MQTEVSYPEALRTSAKGLNPDTAVGVRDKRDSNSAGGRGKGMNGREMGDGRLVVVERSALRGKRV